MTFLELFPLVAAVHIWKVPVARRYQVWLVGHSIVHWAGRCAKKSGWGEHLGLDTSVDIRWLARRGMMWPALLLRLRNSVLQFGFPDAVLLQLGENDIPASKGVALQNSMRDDLMLLHPLFCPDGKSTLSDWGQDIWLHDVPGHALLQWLRGPATELAKIRLL
uniref:Uncharacterized protein n=1 Tax=Sphaerodactylus townsendi TaxID=933632 RepID=A0ACB8G3P5_9SAUR